MIFTADFQKVEFKIAFNRRDGTTGTSTMGQYEIRLPCWRDKPGGRLKIVMSDVSISLGEGL
jgi:hypothetical protein